MSKLDTQYKVLVSYVEVYNEVLHDLLHPNLSSNIACVPSFFEKTVEMTDLGSHLSGSRSSSVLRTLKRFAWAIGMGVGLVFILVIVAVATRHHRPSTALAQQAQAAGRR